MRRRPRDCVMTTLETSSPSLLKERPFVLLWFMRFIATGGYRMLMLLIGWQLYQVTNSALDLGLIGLIQFIPAVGLSLLIGHVADRYDRRFIVLGAEVVYAISAAAILIALIAGVLGPKLIFAVAFVMGCARAFEMPTAHALMPAVVPTSLLSRAVASWTSSNQVAIICGPAVFGFLYVIGPVFVSAVCFACFVTAIGCIMMVKINRVPPPREAPTIASVLGGFDYIRRRKRLLGMITLDLFVMGLGGATAVLPIFASDILQVGPIGLGLLNSAPAIGAVLTSIILSNRPIERRLGLALFGAVSLFGIATAVFAVSTWLPLSLLALAILGASDSISVVIRFTLVQLETPDDMRGRVSAINYLCVGTSNTLGDFRAGAMAAALGAVPAVLIGGLSAVAIAGLWAVLFPDLRRLDRFRTPEDDKRTA